MPGNGIAQVLPIPIAQLYCIIAVMLERLHLSDSTRTGCNDGDRDHHATFAKDLGHTKFGTD